MRRNYNSSILLGQTNARQPYRRFGIQMRDRLSHMYIIGRTGVGKSTLLENMIQQDIAKGEGVTLLDPHGDLIAGIAATIPEHRKDDVIYFDVTNWHQPYGYNPLKRVPRERRPMAASGMMEVFRKLWGEKAWGQRMEYILRNALLALLDQPASDLTHIQRVLTDKSFREHIARNVEHPPVRDFWLKEFKGYSYRYRAEAIAPIQSKIGAFLSDPRLYRILVEPKRPLSLRSIMDQGKILLVNLSVGQIGTDSAALLGGLLVTTLGLAGMSRADTPQQQRRPHWLYLDEFQSFTTLSMATMLSEIRKMNIGMCMAHQYLHQLEPDIRHAVLGNSGTLISFRVGAEDAGFLAKECQSVFTAQDLINLPNYNMYLKLMVDGMPSRPFSADTLPMPQGSGMLQVLRTN
ncbi:type IV secretion system DNA-binding domain-containing protein [uncultured Sneathiella sp.]|uniref:type IV secretory system conjugative DNA transfer family protein n=1 Tax=uncultured Sneathiella sp. TaxID=879315 RepID=UPI0030D8EA97